jgi:predicted dehydrogenase
LRIHVLLSVSFGAHGVPARPFTGKFNNTCCPITRLRTILWVMFSIRGKTEKVRWGILGTGSISGTFVEGLKVLNDAELLAVGSRTQKSADKFGKKYNVPRRYGSYADLAADPDIHVVYIGTPHPMHREDTLLCLNHGKAVLCEKPFAMNARQAEEMISCAREKKLFLMEAMWTHFFPAVVEAQRLVRKGKIGEVRMLKADFCFRAGWDPDKRLLNPQLGGGGLLDVGVYTVAFAQMVLGMEPSSIHAMAHMGKTNVDEQAAMILGYDGGAMAILTCAVRTNTPHQAFIFGTDGWIRVPHPFWQPDSIFVSRGDKEKELKFKRLGNGYSFEAMEVMHCLRKQRLESSIMPLTKTLAVMHTLDRIRAQWGLKYPVE